MSKTAPHHFALLEVAIRTKFLPALLGIATTTDLDGEFRKLLTNNSVKMGGIAIRNPVDAAAHVHEETNLSATSHLLVASMVDKDAPHLDLVEDHHDSVVR